MLSLSHTIATIEFIYLTTLLNFKMDNISLINFNINLEGWYDVFILSIDIATIKQIHVDKEVEV